MEKDISLHFFVKLHSEDSLLALQLSLCFSLSMARYCLFSNFSDIALLFVLRKGHNEQCFLMVFATLFCLNETQEQEHS